MQTRFPDSFYKEKRRFRLVRTADESGMLLNAEDLANHPKPYFMQSQEKEAGEDERRVLVFADHLYAKRGDKLGIYKKMLEAKNAHFEILVLDPSGELKPWDGKKIADNYELPLEKFSDDVIRDLCLTQKGLKSVDLFLLDFPGINELTDKPRKIVEFINFEKKDFQSLVTYMLSSSEQEHCIGLSIDEQLTSFQRLDLKDLLKRKHISFDLTFYRPQSAEHFGPYNLEGVYAVNCPFPASFHPIAAKFNVLKKLLVSVTKNKDYPDFLYAAPLLEELSISSAAYLGDDAALTKPLVFSKLKHLEIDNLGSNNLSKKVVVKFLAASPRLQTLCLLGNTFLDEPFVFPRHFVLPALTKLELQHSLNCIDVFFALANSAPQLQEVNLSSNKQLDLIVRLPDYFSLPQLENINLTQSNISNAVLARMLSAAPKLKILILEECKNLVDKFVPFPVESLSELDLALPLIKHINQDLLAHLLSAPLLTNLNLNQSLCCKEGLLKFEPHSLKNLKILNLNKLKFTSQELTKVLQIAPNLLELKLSNADLTEELVFPPGFEISLKKMELIDTKITPKNLEILRRIAPHCVITDYELSHDEVKSLGNSREPIPETKSTPPPDSFLDTSEKKDTELPFNEFFPGVPENLYRLQLKKLDLNTLNKPSALSPQEFQPDRRSDKELEAYRFTYKGYMPVTEKMGTIVQLPGLSVDEYAHDIVVIDENGNVVKEYKKADRDEETGFSGIDLDEPGNYTIQFNVSLKKDILKDNLSELPPKLKNLALRYRSFEGKETPQTKFKNWHEFAAFIQTNKTGRCDQRSHAAYAELQKAGVLDEDIRLRENETHMMLEVFDEGRWHEVNLGGYEAKAVKKEMALFKRKEVEKKSEPKRIKKYAEDLSKMISEDEAVKINMPVLVQVSDEAAYETFLTKLRAEHQDAIFMAHEPYDVSMTGYRMQGNGTRALGTRFNQWMQNRTKGVICIDMRGFEDNEVVQLNELLCQKIEKKSSFPKDVQIKLLDRPGRKYGPGFKGRVGFKTAAKTAPLKELKESKQQNILEVDLCHSPFWQFKLLGSWIPSPSKGGVKYVWEDGEIIKALTGNKPPTQIILKNPPKDPSYLTTVAELKSLRRIISPDRTMTISDEVDFKERHDTDWQMLSEHASFAMLTNDDRPKVLSDSTVLSFIRPRRLDDAVQESYLNEGKPGQTIDVVCAPSLTESSVELLLKEAAARQVTIRFLSRNTKEMHPALKKLTFKIKEEEKKEQPFKADNVTFETHEDVEFAVRNMLSAKPADTFYYDMSALDAGELGRLYEPIDQKKFNETSVISNKSYLSDILQQLLDNKTVILAANKIPPHLYTALTELSLGRIEGKVFKGKLILVTSLRDANIVEAITGKPIDIKKSTMTDKVNLLKKLYNEDVTLPPFPILFPTLERNFLKEKLRKEHKEFKEDSKASDEENASKYDAHRLKQVRDVLKYQPCVLLPGKTAIGKTKFLQETLPKETTVHELQHWFKKPSLITMDEASFASELSGIGENFLERFKSLRNHPRGFLFKGKYQKLTDAHEAIFAFNPASYGSGRKTKGILEEGLDVPFDALPDFYIRAKMMNMELRNANVPAELIPQIANSMLYVYRWIVQNSPRDKVLISPRHVKCMVQLFTHYFKKKQITDKTVAMHLASEIAKQVGLSVLSDDLSLLDQFDKQFTLTHAKILNVKAPPKEFTNSPQAATWEWVQTLLEARESLTPEQPDLGVGGVFLEGVTNIGKTFFVDAIVEQELQKQKPVIIIEPNTSSIIIEEQLRKAFELGALVIVNEFNANIWPIKLLNNFLMGLDEFGNKAKVPGFFLIATQNPPSYAGHSEIDEAIAQRTIKPSLEDWIVRAPRQAAALGLFQPAVAAPLEDRKDPIRPEGPRT